MQSTVTGLTGTYTVQHPDQVAASEVIGFLERRGALPYRSIGWADGGLALQLGGDGIQVVIDGEEYGVVIFGRSVGVIPVGHNAP